MERKRYSEEKIILNHPGFLGGSVSSGATTMIYADAESLCSTIRAFAAFFEG
jgi:hypothetical protein